MKNLLLSLVISLGSLVSVAQVNIARYLAVGHINDTLKVIDTTNYTVIRSMKMTCDSAIIGATGLARHPQTGVYYIMLRFQDLFNRYLGTINPTNGAVTIIGPVGDRMSNIIFLPTGKLLGVTGDGALTPESLFSLNLSTGTPTFIRALGAGSGGEAIGFCTDNNKVFHRSGISNQAYEKMDTVFYNLTPIPQQGNPGNETFCMLYAGFGNFISIDRNNDVVIIDTLGNYTFKSNLSQPYKGLEYLNCTRNITGTLSICAGESTVLTATAGASSYAWYKNGVLLSGTNSPTLTVTSAGKYNCMFTDLCGADSLPASVTVTQKSLPLVSLSGAAEFCEGSATLLSGTGGGTSQWYKNSILINGATSSTYLVSSPGLYNMIKTNTNGCKDSAAVGISVTMNPKPLIVISAVHDVICNGGNTGVIDVVMQNGTAPYTYNWSNGTSLQGASSLTAGTYVLICEDSKQCKDTASAQVNEAPAITLSLSASAVLCNGGNTGSAAAIATGGTGLLSYSWSNGNTLATNTNLPAGMYSILVQDDSLCTKLDSIEVTEPGILLTNFSSTNVTCNGLNNGAAQVIVSGGTLPYFYNWSNGGNFDTINNLSAGYYIITTVDGNLCTSIDSVEIIEPAVLLANLSSTSVTCFGNNDGVAMANPSGGVGSYTYSWSSGTTGQSSNNLTAGTYSVTISDANLCNITDTVSVLQPSLLIIDTILVTNASGGLNNGSIDVIAMGGVLPYTYNWSDGSTTQSISNLSPGIYFVTITDQNGCDTQSVNISLLGVGIKESSSVEHIKVVPNPSRGDFKVITESNMQLDLYSIQGVKVASYSAEKNQPLLIHTQLADGIYYLQGRNDQEQIVYKICIRN
ncbi:MAG TPA: T9SS type A sorting domain-containing protein [Bacteroidia bacterium]|nr:T9SS type A sorting domain-containing protein [Bacteroidia bacterium]HRH07962.1 T9SS type A sorting domain-containing protein [Bacteroidia bacterium]